MVDTGRDKKYICFICKGLTKESYEDMDDRPAQHVFRCCGKVWWGHFRCIHKTHDWVDKVYKHCPACGSRNRLNDYCNNISVAVGVLGWSFVIGHMVTPERIGNLIQSYLGILGRVAADTVTGIALGIFLVVIPGFLYLKYKSDKGWEAFHAEEARRMEEEEEIERLEKLEKEKQK